MQEELQNDKIRLLAIFKDSIMLDYLGKLMSTDEYSCSLVSNTENIIALLKQVKPAILLVDDFTAQQLGIEICKIVKSVDELNSIPLILYTDQKSELTTKHLCDVFIEKPANANEFIEQIDEVAIQYVIRDENVAFDYI
ncbi:MAG: hypothetical protein EOO47_04285 [Flavobacterium sp.]|nr:MAG: hypothetical protein EOO47_04285 [Flavobacterium sp.]